MRFRDFIFRSIVDPGVIAKKLETFPLTFSDLIQGLFFVSISSVVITYATFWIPSLIFGEPLNELSLVLSMVKNNPFVFVTLQSIILLMISLVVAFGGRFFNGIGSFNDSLAGVLWINFILVGVNIFQILLIISIPVLADFLALVASFWSIWALTVFSKELHGFNSVAVTGLVGLIFFSIAVLILGSLLTFFGFIVIEGV